MKYGISSWSLSKLSNNNDFEMINLASELGFNAIDYSFDVTDFDYLSKPLEEVEAYYRKLKDYALAKGIIFNQIHAKYTAFPNYLLRNYQRIIIRSIQVCHYLDCPYMVMHPQVFPLNKEKDFTVYETQFNVEFYQRLLRYLEQYQVKLCLENIYDWDHREIRQIYVSHPDNLREYVELINSDLVGICLDTGHMHLAKENMYQAIKCFSDKLWVLHLHDNYGLKDDHFVLGEGTINWNDVKQGLVDINFQGVLNLEIKPLDDKAKSFDLIAQLKEIFE